MNRISNYDELAAERSRIENNIIDHKRNIRRGIDEVRQRLEPFLYLLPVLSIFKNKTSALKSVGNVVLDSSVGKKLISRTPWLIRFLIPIVKRLL